MLEWLRAYNQQHATKIHYVGIDMQSPEPNLRRLGLFATQRKDTVLQRQLRQLTASHAAPSQPSGKAEPRLGHLTRPAHSAH